MDRKSPGITGIFLLVDSSRNSECKDHFADLNKRLILFK